METTELESSIEQLTEILSKISSSVGFSKIINNFVIQKEKEKLTIFPLGIGNDKEKNDHENGDHGIKSGNHENGSGYHKSGNGDGDDENHKELKQFLKGGHYKAGSSDLEYEIGYFDQLLEKGESDSFYGYNDSEIIVDEAGSLRFKKGDKSQYSTFRAVFVEKQMPQFTEGLLEAQSSTISSILGMLEFWSTIVQNGRGDVVGLP